MKTINKQSDYYVQKIKSVMEADGVDMSGKVARMCLRLTRESFIHGATQMQEELTRWYDPKEELPDNNHCVLIKISDGPQERIHIGTREGDVWMADGGFLFHADPASSIGFDGVVIGWRPIHE